VSIHFKNVHKSFGPKNILHDVSFEVPKGEILFVLGRSGMGKSVILKHLVGLMKPDQGEISVDGILVNKLSEPELSPVRKICGMVFQHPALFDSISVYDNIAFGLRGQDPHHVRSRVHECLGLVHLDSRVLNKFPSEISYGMQKRVSLARSIAPGPRYVLFDEPTTGLDPITTSAINELIYELSRNLNVTSIVVSHDMGCALKIADKIMVLDQSKILAHGTVTEIKAHKASLIQQFLKESVIE
jgi:phospholipid/cholesterol/gamma-HCH transport system ATP-binding protein